MSFQSNTVISKIYDRIPITLYSKNATIKTSTTNFTVSFETPYKNVRNVIFDSFVIPFTYYVFKSTNNTLSLTLANGLTQLFTITPGNYQTTSMISELQTQLNSAGNYGVTVTSASDILTIASTNTISTFRILAYPQLGFTTDSASATSVTANVAISPLPTVIPVSNITIEWNGSSRVIALTPGTYNTAAEVATMVQTVINAVLTVGSGAFAVTFNEYTYKYTFSNSSTFIININAASQLLGFSTVQTQALTQTANNVSDIAGPDYFGVKSLTLSKLRANSSVYNGLTDTDVVYFISILNSPGDNIVDLNMTDYALRFMTSVTLSEIDIQILLPDSTILDNNANEITISLILEIE